MDFMDILMEAKGEKKTKITISEDDTKEAEDYTETEDENTDSETDEENDESDEETGNVNPDDAEDPDDAPTDYTEDSDNETSEETEDDTGNSDGVETDTTEDSDDAPTDYTEDSGDVTPEGEDGDDDSESSVSPDTTGEDDESTSNNKILINDFLVLYDSIKTNSDKLDKLKTYDMVSSQIIGRVKDMMSELMEYVYSYVSKTFSSKTYVENLYTYNYCVQLFKISAQMLLKINNFKDAT